MDDYRRYALYYTPPQGEFADFGTSWLGWDAARGMPVAQPVLPGLDLAALTAEPRKYGFHATLKAPFRLVEGARADELADAVAALAAQLQPLTLDGLELTRIGAFLALTPTGDTGALNALAARVVEELDPFRAPMNEAERARRNPDRLTPRQRTLLDLWGYPYVFEEFRFHMTLTGALDADTLDAVTAQLAPRLAVVPRPFTLDALSLMGEDASGRVHLIRRMAL
ncbi:DUF1045 domain-containing protein [Paracoccus xiamenensis]|uniref:DUF1045 domain-containing protein n=1 Tax=Paracoccus xiamenensis TaxID=2714901 RepID=UPI001407D4AB|nr:DUF1045 domain-containing protein [Paracoccus xiamenensis]NHF71564.1 DUF1045 domain-containing protein [Paracoccus xiamenensis]